MASQFLLLSVDDEDWTANSRMRITIALISFMPPSAVRSKSRAFSALREPCVNPPNSARIPSETERRAVLSRDEFMAVPEERRARRSWLSLSTWPSILAVFTAEMLLLKLRPVIEPPCSQTLNFT